MKTLFVVCTLVAAVGSGAIAAPVAERGTWVSTLEGRDLNGDGAADAFYDRVLDITWLRNANVNGTMNWEAAMTWAAGLSVGGLAGWRLPTVIDTGQPGCDKSYSGGTDCGYNVQTKSGSQTSFEVGQTVYSEFAHLWYVTLGNKPYCDSGEQLILTCWAALGPVDPEPGLYNTGNFENLLPALYWMGTESGPQANAWLFHARNGRQDVASKHQPFYAIAVRDGDPFSVPEPSAASLLVVALGALGLVRRRRKH